MSNIFNKIEEIKNNILIKRNTIKCVDDEILREEEQLAILQKVLQVYKTEDFAICQTDNEFIKEIQSFDENVNKQFYIEYYGGRAPFLFNVNYFHLYSIRSVVYYQKYHLLDYDFQGKTLKVAVTDFRQTRLAEEFFGDIKFYPIDEFIYSNVLSKKYNQTIIDWIDLHLKANENLKIDWENCPEKLRSLMNFL